MPDTTTAVQIMRDVCEELHSDVDVEVLRTTDGDSADAGEIIDSELIDSDADTDKLGRPWVRIDSQPASGPPSGEVRRVASGGLAIATGVVSVSNNFTATIDGAANPADFSLWYDFHPGAAFRAMNRVLRRTKRKVVSPVTKLSNGDMENSTITSGWAGAATANVTQTAATAAARVRHGAQSQEMAGNAGAPTVESETLRVIAGKQYLLAAYAMCDAGTITMAAYDQTNAANIDTASHDEEAFMELELQNFLAPSGCEEMSVRFTGTAASDDFYVDDVVFWPTEEKFYVLPSWVNDPNDVIGFHYYPRGRSLVGTQAYAIDEHRRRRFPWRWQTLTDEGSPNAFQVEFELNPWRPLFMEAYRPFAELSLDTDTTTCPREFLVDATLAEIYQRQRAGAIRSGEGADAGLYGSMAAEYRRRANSKAGNLRVGQPDFKVKAPRFVGLGGRGSRPRWNG